MFRKILFYQFLAFQEYTMLVMLVELILSIVSLGTSWSALDLAKLWDDHTEEGGRVD